MCESVFLLFACFFSSFLSSLFPPPFSLYSSTNSPTNHQALRVSDFAEPDDGGHWGSSLRSCWHVMMEFTEGERCSLTTIRPRQIRPHRWNYTHSWNVLEEAMEMIIWAVSICGSRCFIPVRFLLSFPLSIRTHPPTPHLALRMSETYPNIGHTAPPTSRSYMTWGVAEGERCTTTFIYLDRCGHRGGTTRAAGVYVTVGVSSSSSSFSPYPHPYP
jgi:hypothetical protein